jgi:hypothetical protein
MSRHKPTPDIKAAPNADSPASRESPAWANDMWAAGFVALVAYVVTLCPTIYTDDCGEITTAVATGGVMHPTGYPLYTMVGWLFVHLIRAGEPAWRLGLLSSVCGALAVVLVHRLCRRIGANRLWSFGCALAFAFSYVFWQQAAKVETYTLNALFVAALLDLSLTYGETGERKWFYALCGCAGLALTNHRTIVFLFPALLWMALPQFLRIAAPVRTLLLGLAQIAAAQLLYAYEWIAAKLHPGAQNWGDPTSVNRFIYQVLGKEYTMYLFSIAPMGMFERDFVHVPIYLWRNLNILLFLAVAGAVVLWKSSEHRRTCQAVLVAIAGYMLFTTVYGVVNIFEYYTPIILMGCVLASAGGTALGQRLSSCAPLLRTRAGVSLLFTVVCGITVVLPFVWNLRDCNHARATFVRSYAMDVLDETPNNAVLVVNGDNNLFPLWYLQYVLHYRPDVLVVDRQSLGVTPGVDILVSGGRWYVERLASLDPSGGWLGLQPERIGLFRYLWAGVQREAFLGRPLFFLSDLRSDETDSGPGGIPELRYVFPHLSLVPFGLLSAAVQPAGISTHRLALDNDAICSALIADLPSHDVTEEDTNASNTMFSSYSLAFKHTGELYEADQDFNKAYYWLERASRVSPGVASIQNALAIACEETGRKGEAIAAWRCAVADDPSDGSYRISLQRAGESSE